MRFSILIAPTALPFESRKGVIITCREVLENRKPK